ncbi:MAG TPA: stage III sporulation protein AA [Bacillota bacterium]|nr:stage III sporulation protein AA [Bacillota bacterium]
MEVQGKVQRVTLDKVSQDKAVSVIQRLPASLSQVLALLPGDVLARVEEIRLRQGKPLMVRCDSVEQFVNYGSISDSSDRAYRVTLEDVQRTVQVLTGSSLYACEEELRQGFLTISGGHRVGLTGSVVVREGRVETLREITGLNIRIAREFPDVGLTLVPRLLRERSRQIAHTLIISPPGCGKTTLLRDLIRLVSNGVPHLKLAGRTVGVVDERSELAGGFQGIAQLDVGVRTDVLSGCPKAEGMMMLLRAMGPEVIAADEIGSVADIAALEEVLNGGVTILTTIHGSSLEDLWLRPGSRALLEMGVFEKAVVLSRNKGVGTIEQVIDLQTVKNKGG